MDSTWGLSWRVPPPRPPSLLFSPSKYSFFCFLFLSLFSELLCLLDSHPSESTFPPLGLWPTFALMEQTGNEGASDSCRMWCREGQKKWLLPRAAFRWSSTLTNKPFDDKSGVCYGAQGMPVSFPGLTKTSFNYLSLVGVKVLEMAGGNMWLGPQGKEEGGRYRGKSGPILEEVSWALRATVSCPMQTSSW